MIKRTAAILIVSLALSACGSNQASPPAPAQETIAEVAAPTETMAEQISQTENTATEEPAAAVPDESTAPPAAESEEQTLDDTTTEVPANAGQEAELVIEPIEVTYFTPSQGEGPYYTVDKPADRDNDLTVLAGAADVPLGQIIEINGKVYNAGGRPLAGLTVEIWQTDHNGFYLHPNDPGTGQRDQNFQFYGETVTAGNGDYSFRTILPGHYEPRPRHIHLKVRHGQEELLTSQLYFTGDAALQTDGIFLDGDSENEHLVMMLEAGQDTAGNPILLGEFNIILNTNLSTMVEEAAIEKAPEEVEATTVNAKLNINMAGGAEFQSAIPDFGNRMVREFLEYQPYISIQQFRREIGKYVNEAQVAEYEQYVYVPVNVDEADAATLQQLPGVDDAVAAELMAARPFGSNDAFLAKLADYVSDAELAIANSYLATQ